MRSFGLSVLVGALAGVVGLSSVSAQEDPNARTPQFAQIGENSLVIVGDDAWGNMLATVDLYQRASVEQNQVVIDQIWERRDEVPPVLLFEVTRRSVVSNPDLALEAYLLGRARVIYDARRCLDSSAINAVPIATSFAGEHVPALIEAHPESFERILRRIHDNREAFNGQNSPWWICSFGDTAVSAAQNGATLSGPEWLKSELVWPRVQEEINANMLGFLEIVRAGIASQDN